MSMWIVIAVWLGIAIVAIGVARFVMGEEFEAEEHVPPCILWPVCMALLLPIAAGWVLFYWVPVTSADTVRAIQSRRIKRKKLQSPVGQQHFKEPPDWR